MKKFCPICLEDLETTYEFCQECGKRLVHLDPEDLTGSTLDEKYEIDSILATGGMGVVYRARQLYLHREIALKVLRADLPRDSAATKRFMLEVRSASSLRNPHTVTIHDFGISPDGRLYFAMELLEGEGLNEALARGPLPWPDAVTIARQACSSLAEAHSRGIWHRDIKPANLFLTRTDTGEVFIKLLDFGIAKAEDHPPDLTAPGGSFGTPDFTSPEQAMDSEVDHRSDIYSLGLVLYEMLCGRRPFSGAAREVLLSHIRDKPQPVDQVVPELNIPESLARATMWALEKLPGRRPQTMQEWSLALENAISNEEWRQPLSPLGDSTVVELPPTPTPSEPIELEGVEREVTEDVPEREPKRTPEKTPPSVAVPPSLPSPLPPPVDYSVNLREPETPDEPPIAKRRPVLFGVVAIMVAAVVVFVWSPWTSWQHNNSSDANPANSSAENLPPASEQQVRAAAQDAHGQATTTDGPTVLAPASSNFAADIRQEASAPATDTTEELDVSNIDEGQTQSKAALRDIVLDAHLADARPQPDSHLVPDMQTMEAGRSNAVPAGHHNGAGGARSARSDEHSAAKQQDSAGSQKGDPAGKAQNTNGHEEGDATAKEEKRRESKSSDYGNLEEKGTGDSKGNQQVDEDEYGLIPR